MEQYPRIGAAYREMGDAVAEAGPLDEKTRALIKLGICFGANMEGAAHSHVRKAMDAGATPDELRHAALQALTTTGFPNMMRGMIWVEEVIVKAETDPST